jgi:prepilin peptidase CpaA
LGYGGTSLLIEGFASAFAAGALLFIPFLMKGAGGGDVKMMFAAGAVVGWARLIPMLFMISLFGVIIGVIMLISGKMDGARLKHYMRCLFDWRYDRKAGAKELPPKESEKVRMPFSIPITLGMIVVLTMC